MNNRVQAYKKRKLHRLLRRFARYDDEKGQWITVNGTHIHISEEGKADKGPKEVKEALNKQEIPLTHPPKKKVNASIKQIVDKVGSNATEKDITAVKSILETLEPGSKVTIPARWGDESYTYVKSKWGGWETKEGWTNSDEGLAWDFFADDETERAFVSSSAMSEQDKINDYSRSNSWRDKQSPWVNDKPLSETVQTKLYSLDLKTAGQGTRITLKDGTEAVCYGDGYWERVGENRFLSNKELKGAKHTGDFYDTMFGLNGVSKSEIDAMRGMVDSMPYKQKVKYEKAFRFHPVEAITDENEGEAYFSTKDLKVHLRPDQSAATLIHEYTHSFDYGAGEFKYKSSYGETIAISTASLYIDKLTDHPNKEDFETMAKEVGFKTNGNGWFENSEDKLALFHTATEWRKKNEKKVQGDKSIPIKGFSAVCDAISGLTLDACGFSILGGGHSPEYWSSWYGAGKSSPQSKEYWANFCELKLTGCTDALEYLKKITPNKYAAAEKAYKEAFGIE